MIVKTEGDINKENNNNESECLAINFSVDQQLLF